MTLNVEKTKFISIGSLRQYLVLQTGKEIQFNEDMYRGVKITNDGNHEVEIIDRNRKGKNGISLMNIMLWDEDMTKNTIHQIYNTNVIKYNDIIFW